MSQKQMQLFVSFICLTLFFISGLSIAAQNKVEQDSISSTPLYSGFLQDYSKLQKVTDSHGNELLRWVDSSITQRGYKKFLVKVVVFYPEAKPTKQVSSETLEEVRQYMASNLRERLSAHDLLADAPGDGVLEIRTAITAVDVKPEGLKFWEFVPFALIRAGIQTASGRRDHDVKLFLESEVLDSPTQQVMLQSVREGTGLQLDNDRDPLTLTQLKPKMDQWIEAVMKLVTALQPMD